MQLNVFTLLAPSFVSPVLMLSFGFHMFAFGFGNTIHTYIYIKFSIPAIMFQIMQAMYPHNLC